MKITSIATQQKNPNRVNISVDGAYRFSLDVFQVSELGIKVGKEYSDEELAALEQESTFGKLYGRALEYCLMRPHSAKEVLDYLRRKTRPSKVRLRGSGEIKDRPGVSQQIADRVYERLTEKGYVDDEKFARFWVENRNQTKGTSQRKLTSELRAKGVEQVIINTSLSTSLRRDDLELRKVIAKKGARYEDPKKLISYLMRQGFGYGDIVKSLNQSDLAGETSETD